MQATFYDKIDSNLLPFCRWRMSIPLQCFWLFRNEFVTFSVQCVTCTYDIVTCTFLFVKCLLVSHITINCTCMWNIRYDIRTWCYESIFIVWYLMFLVNHLHKLLKIVQLMLCEERVHTLLIETRELHLDSCN